MPSNSNFALVGAGSDIHIELLATSLSDRAELSPAASHNDIRSEIAERNTAGSASHNVLCGLALGSTGWLAGVV